MNPMFMPWMRPPPDYINEVPARVAVALRLLDMFTDKSSKTFVTNDMAIEEFEGAELLPVKRQTQACALLMLQAYLGGTLQPTEEEKAAKEPRNGGGLIPCPVCGGSGGGRSGHCCQMCQGKGKVLFQGMQ